MHPCLASEGAVPATVRPRWELADVFRVHGAQYRREHSLPGAHVKVMRLIETCRTAELGGHLERCNACGYERPAYNSCRDRHCPKCQTLAKEKWLEDRTRELLPVKYFHNVFSLPHDLNPLILVNKAVGLAILFRAAAEALQDFAADPRWKLGGQLGFLAVLHTWSQTLLDHFHIHCVIPAGALSFDRTRWIPCPREDFLFHVEALSRTFRGKFLYYLKQAYKENRLVFPGQVASLAKPRQFYRLFRSLKEKDWVVYSKEPFAGPDHVMKYLARYTHRVALSNDRIKNVSDGQVTFSYRDRTDNDCVKEMTLPATEFIRRFLLHVLPDGFVRIRHFGFLANAAKKHALTVIRRRLRQPEQISEKTDDSVRAVMLRLTGVDITVCPHCKIGTMTRVGVLPRTPQLQPPLCRSP